ncbi:MAG: cysteine desulfurase, partial [Patescibacteria group bacterium]|nr:cysteine desulfurase [Patescibacteria group bacterium]
NLQPLIYGGGQEYSLRSGTENVAQCIGFATAFEQAKSNAKSEVKRLGKIRDEAINELLKLPKIMLNGPKGSKRLANNINITVNGIDNERLLMQLDEQGFIVATGSACSASNDEPSHVLKAIGLSDTQAQSTIRITLGRSTTKDSCTLLCKTILQLVK